MSSALQETHSEFEEQLRLQASSLLNTAECKKKTRVDDDGTTMEWNEEKKAWFPQIDDNFIASYQMNFGVHLTENGDVTTNSPAASVQNAASTHAAWAAYAAQLDHLKSTRAADPDKLDPGLDEQIKSATISLNEYYASPAYRLWYEEYQRKVAQNQQIPKTFQKPNEKPLQTRKQRVANMFISDGGASAEEALERAEEEQRLGLPLTTESQLMPEKIPAVSKGSGSKEPAEGLPEPPKSKKRMKKDQIEWYEIDDEKNTHVYVSGLPPSISEAAFVELMTKCGIIMNDPLTQKLRVKLYKGSDGTNKGDGLCSYIKMESVDLALQILDGMLYEPGYTLHVERAKFKPKTDFDASRHRRLTAKEKKKFKKQQDGLFKWGVDPSKLIRGKKERVIIIRSAFDEADLGLDVSLIPIVRERVRLQCAKVGVVKKIVVYDANKEGVVVVTFSSPEEADVAINFLDKALFTYPAPTILRSDDEGASVQQRTRQLLVSRWDGKERFNVGETAEEEAERLARWNKFLDDEELNNEDDDNEDDNDDQSDAKPVDERVDINELNTSNQLEVEEEPEPVDTDEELADGSPHDSGAETD